MDPRQWSIFAERVSERLKQGEKLYGGASFWRSESELLSEIEEEILDICGWAFILYARIERLRAARELTQLGEADE